MVRVNLKFFHRDVQKVQPSSYPKVRFLANHLQIFLYHPTPDRIIKDPDSDPLQQLRGKEEIRRVQGEHGRHLPTSQR